MLNENRYELLDARADFAPPRPWDDQLFKVAEPHDLPSVWGSIVSRKQIDDDFRPPADHLVTPRAGAIASRLAANWATYSARRFHGDAPRRGRFDLWRWLLYTRRWLRSVGGRRRDRAAQTQRMTLTLHRFALSGHCHRVELLLSLLGLSYERIDVDLLKGEQKQPAFRTKNPLGQVPVIEDGDVTVADSNAILVYLALRYDASGRWLPREPLAAAEVQRWFSLAVGQLVLGPGQLRLAALLGAPVDRPRAERMAADLLGLLEARLREHAFLVGDRPTVADLAHYAYTAVAPEGGISLEPYPALRSWHARIEALPGFVPMHRWGAPTAA